MRKQIPSQRHEDAIPSGTNRRGFAAALRLHTGIRLGRHPFVPDAFTFDVDARALTLYEVTVTHALGEEKLSKLRLLRDVLETLGWSMQLRGGGPRDGGRSCALDLTTGHPTDDELRKAVLMLDVANHP